MSLFKQVPTWFIKQDTKIPTACDCFWCNRVKIYDEVESNLTFENPSNFHATGCVKKIIIFKKTKKLTNLQYIYTRKIQTKLVLNVKTWHDIKWIQFIQIPRILILILPVSFTSNGDMFDLTSNGKRRKGETEQP